MLGWRAKIVQVGSLEKRTRPRVFGAQNERIRRSVAKKSNLETTCRNSARVPELYANAIVSCLRWTRPQSRHAGRPGARRKGAGIRTPVRMDRRQGHVQMVRRRTFYR